MAAIALFLFANILVISFGVAYQYLLVVAACAALILLVRASPGHSIASPRSSLFLLAFLTYFLLRLLFDLPDFAAVKSMSIGTNGGVVFGLGLGTCASLFVTRVHTRDGRNRATLATLFFLLLCVFYAFRAYAVHLQSIRADLFLVKSNGGDYQRPGDFAILVELLASVLLAQTSTSPRKDAVVFRIAFGLSLAAYFALTALLLITSQLIGSNTGFIVTIFVAIGTLAWLWRPGLAALRWKTLLSLRRLEPSVAFANALPRLALNGVIVLGIAIACGLGLLAYLHLGIHQFRIFGFGHHNITYSLVGRLDLDRRNFLPQFAYRPFFGDMNVDALTTGRGSYAHSLISLLSHTGIVGAALFVAYLRAAYRDLRLRKGGATLYTDPDLGIFRMIIMIMLLVYATIGTFFTWLPLWFSFGLLSPVIVLRPLRIGEVGSDSRAPNQAAVV